MVGAMLVLGALLVAALFALGRPSPLSALALVVLCGGWLSANNAVLEGPVLYTIDTQRGITAADLVSYGGFAIAVLTVLRWWRAQPGRRATTDSRRPWIAAAVTILGLVVVMGSAMAVTWVNQPG